NGHGADRRRGTADQQYRAPAPAAELVAVAPGRELRPLRRAHTHQLQPLAEPRESDVVRGDTHPRVAEGPLAGLDGLPARVERTQVPTLATATDHPEPALGTIERQAAAHRKLLDGLVAAQGLVTEDAGLEHL